VHLEEHTQVVHGAVVAFGGRGLQLLTGGDQLGQVDWVTFSPNGLHLANAGNDGRVRVWDVYTGQLLGDPLIGHAGAVRCVVFSPDGRRLASASDHNTVRLWDTGTGQPLGEPVIGHAGAVFGVTFSPGGHRLDPSKENSHNGCARRFAFLPATPDTSVAAGRERQRTGAVTVSTLSGWLDKKRDQITRCPPEMFNNSTTLLGTGSRDSRLRHCRCKRSCRQL
jgi:hypothetical protein